MAAWWMLSAYFFVLKCDESCGGSDPDHWEYTAQAIWVGAASATALAGIFLGIRGRLHTFALLFSLAVTAAVAWLYWAWSGGFQG